MSNQTQETLLSSIYNELFSMLEETDEFDEEILGALKELAQDAKLTQTSEIIKIFKMVQVKNHENT